MGEGAGTGDLAGRRILVPESRELDLFSRMLEGHGAETLRCPMVSMENVDDPAPVEAWLRRLIDGRFDDLILLTGEGLRRLTALAGTLGIDAAMVEALGRLRTVTRGPKPVRALRELGLSPFLTAPAPTTEGVIEALKTLDLSGRTVGVQLYPDNPNEPLLSAIADAGATADAVVPYRYANDAETGRVEAAIREMAAGRIDFVAFTSSPQVRRLRDVARDRGLEAELQAGLARTRIAAVGPVVAEAVEAAGARVEIAPESVFHMKPLVNAIREKLRAE